MNQIKTQEENLEQAVSGTELEADFTAVQKKSNLKKRQIGMLMLKAKV